MSGVLGNIQGYWRVKKSERYPAPCPADPNRTMEFWPGDAFTVMYDYTDEKVEIELTWGVQSDCENYKHVENLTLIRKTMKWED